MVTIHSKMVIWRKHIMMTRLCFKNNSLIEVFFTLLTFCSFLNAFAPDEVRSFSLLQVLDHADSVILGSIKDKTKFDNFKGGSYEIEVQSSLKVEIGESKVLVLEESNDHTGCGTNVDKVPQSGRFIAFLNDCSWKGIKYFCNYGIHPESNFKSSSFEKFWELLIVLSSENSKEQKSTFLKSLSDPILARYLTDIGFKIGSLELNYEQQILFGKFLLNNGIQFDLDCNFLLKLDRLNSKILDTRLFEQWVSESKNVSVDCLMKYLMRSRTDSDRLLIIQGRYEFALDERPRNWSELKSLEKEFQTTFCEYERSRGRQCSVRRTHSASGYKSR